MAKGKEASVDLQGYSATGPREANEDNFYVLDFSDYGTFTNGICALAVVSDGMGGYLGGDIASSIVVTEAERYMSQLLEMAKGNQIEFDAPAALDEIVQNAHAIILEEAEKNGGRSMGATFVGAFISPTHAWIGHVGDSRAYLIHEGEAIQLTEDHSQVGRMLSRGLISEEEAQNHPDRNKIEQALGFTIMETEIDEVDIEAGDSLVLCSDGVYTVVNYEKLATCVQKSHDAESAAINAVNAALSAHTDDNSTAVVVFPDRPAVRKKNAADTLPGTIIPGTMQAIPSAAPTTRMNPVSPTRRHTHTHVAQRKPEGKPGFSSLGPDKRSFLVPLLIGIGLLLLVCALFATTCNNGDVNQPSSGSAIAPEPTSVQKAEETTASASSTITNPSSTSANTQTESTPVGSAQEKEFEIETFSNANLRYVGKDGAVHAFEGITPPFIEPRSPNIKVVGEAQTDSDGAYRTLDQMYVAELKSDLKEYEQKGTEEFDSLLATAIGKQGPYRNFIVSLAENNFDMDSIDKLIINESDVQEALQHNNPESNSPEPENTWGNQGNDEVEETPGNTYSPQENTNDNNANAMNENQSGQQTANTGEQTNANQNNYAGGQ